MTDTLIREIINEIESEIAASLKGSPKESSEQCHRRALRDAIIIIRKHAAQAKPSEMLFDKTQAVKECEVQLELGADANEIVEALRPYMQRKPKRECSEIRLTQTEWADKILADFQTENNRTKADEWEAAYAMLFRQLNELAATKRESVNQRLLKYLETIAEEKDDHLRFDAQAYAQQALSEIEDGVGK